MPQSPSKKRAALEGRIAAAAAGSGVQVSAAMNRHEFPPAIWFWCVMLTSILLMGCNWMLHGEHTDFASGYSERKFRQIKQGMPMQEVVSLLGSPLRQSTSQWSEVWTYWPSGSAPKATSTTDKDGAITFSNVFGPVTHLRFTPTGTVMAVSGDYLNGNFAGLTKEEVRAKVGEPGKRTLRQLEIVYHYTRPGKFGTGTYKRRRVGFDASNNVSFVVATTFYD